MHAVVSRCACACSSCGPREAQLSWLAWVPLLREHPEGFESASVIRGNFSSWPPWLRTAVRRSKAARLGCACARTCTQPAAASWTGRTTRPSARAVSHAMQPAMLGSRPGNAVSCVASHAIQLAMLGSQPGDAVSCAVSHAMQLVVLTVSQEMQSAVLSAMQCSRPCYAVSHAMQPAMLGSRPCNDVQSAVLSAMQYSRPCSQPCRKPCMTR